MISRVTCAIVRAMHPRRLLPSCMLCILLLTICAAAGDEIGQPAPRFRAKTTAGEQFNNESIKGKVVLFELWTTSCKYCEEEAELADDIAKEFKDKRLIVLAADGPGPVQKVTTYLFEHPAPPPIVP